MPALSIVIVNWNSKDDLRGCLASLAAQTETDLETIVVDNGSTDGSAEMVAAGFPAVRLERSTENLGFAEGCNRGIALSTGPWVAMLNNDTVADPEWARSLVEAAARAPAACGMLQALMLFRDRPDVINSTGLELTRGGAGRDRLEGRPRPQASDTAPQEIFCPTGGAAAYRRTMLDAVRLADGWFDRHHFMYFEDLDLGWRARIAGWTARYIPAAIVFHTWHGSVERHGESWRLILASTNRARTLAKNASGAFIAGASLHSLWHLLRVVRHGGVGGLRGLMAATSQGFRQRREVARLSRVDRRDVERMAVW